MYGNSPEREGRFCILSKFHETLELNGVGFYFVGGPGSSVGIATDYGLDGPGIESRRGRDFSHTSRPALGPTQPPVQWVPGVKQPGRCADHPPPPSTEVKNE
jgi:hypothetical protein